MSVILSILKPKHLLKNLFVFLPVLFGKELFSCPNMLQVVIAFCAFFPAANACYLFNDIQDLESDKLHPVKRHRPLAAGKISVSSAYITAALLAILSIAIAFLASTALVQIILSYLGLNILYSLFLKKMVIVDVFCLGIFYVLRILAGGVACGIKISHWMFILTFLLAMFLGFTKRRQDRVALYDAYFVDQMTSVLTASIVIVYMLYTVDARTVTIFNTHHLFYSIVFVYYGIFRYLYLIHQKETIDDPVNVLYNDRAMQINLLLWVFTCMAVIYYHL